jgi:hypothetical protein
MAKNDVLFVVSTPFCDGQICDGQTGKFATGKIDKLRARGKQLRLWPLGSWSTHVQAIRQNQAWSSSQIECGSKLIDAIMLMTTQPAKATAAGPMWNSTIPESLISITKNASSITSIMLQRPENSITR